MAIEVKVPAAGESITSANVANWRFKDGDPVRAGDVLVTLETDKVSNELTAEASGTIQILVGEGEEVAIGTVIAKIEETAASAQEVAESPPTGTSDSTESNDAGRVVSVKVPAAGESIASANVATWHKRNGDVVAKGEVLVTLETDKVSSELEADVAGTLTILVAQGEEVSIGTEIAQITTGATPAPAPAAEKKVEEPVAKPTSSATAAKPAAAPKISLPVSAAEKPDTKATSDGRTTRKKMSMLRRKIATHLVNAQQTAAILTTFNEADMSAVMKLRKDVQDTFVSKYGVKLGFMSFFVKAVVQALKDVPAVNGMIDGTDIIENHFYDIGVAIGTEKGLVVPVLRDCDKKSFAEIESEIIDYAMKARDGKIQIEDLQGGVFTISNGGTYGSLLSTPILNPPQSGILGMHTIQQRPVAVAGKVEIRPMMYLAMSYDHRLVDGKEAVTFLIRIKECIENPTRLLLEM
ncbi:2-oxoglutarate dehydrogenase E2 component (dihydrolipoamide succinyltransferase) [Haloferula luteola]|uniref:Dihydrolipoyllysine-residue succinyltransferase n=1 Tax=Haloferula luteola TaxID=595692 RepID=A0A840VFM7_9BACT|nr:dihydrolipoyllysine-residue succinyltransferase [Haloferula luteola]MBB5352620.1 2-oxoglutarate dehydrogenase E2 component (dihydrolipoamide succinyltransferase) [Haloferula luteola]